MELGSAGLTPHVLGTSGLPRAAGGERWGWWDRCSQAVWDFPGNAGCEPHPPSEFLAVWGRLGPKVTPSLPPPGLGTVWQGAAVLWGGKGA